MNFTKKLYNETKDSHKQIDTHPFIELIRKNKIAADLYINFNKICIYEIQKYLKLNNKILQKKLHRDIIQPDISIHESLIKLLLNCKDYPLELEYMFKGGLIKGGNLLKRYVSNEHHLLLTFENPNELFNKLKSYLDENVKDKDKDDFIKIVNESYILINEYFDFLFEKYTNEII